MPDDPGSTPQTAINPAKGDISIGSYGAAGHILYRGSAQEGQYVRFGENVFSIRSGNWGKELFDPGGGIVQAHTPRDYNSGGYGGYANTSSTTNINSIYGNTTAGGQTAYISTSTGKAVPESQILSLKPGIYGTPLNSLVVTEGKAPQNAGALFQKASSPSFIVSFGEPVNRFKDIKRFEPDAWFSQQSAVSNAKQTPGSLNAGIYGVMGVGTNAGQVFQAAGYRSDKPFDIMRTIRGDANTWNRLSVTRPLTYEKLYFYDRKSGTLLTEKEYGLYLDREEAKVKGYLDLNSKTYRAIDLPDLGRYKPVKINTGEPWIKTLERKSYDTSNYLIDFAEAQQAGKQAGKTNYFRSELIGISKYAAAGAEVVGKVSGYLGGDDREKGVIATAAVFGAAANALERGLYSLNLWSKGTRFASLAEKGSKAGEFLLTGAGLSYLGAEAYRYNTAADIREQVNILSDLGISVATFEATRTATKMPIRMAFTYGVDVPMYNYYKTKLDGNAQGRYVPLIELTTKGTIEGRGLFYAEGSTPQERTGWSIKTLTTPKTARPAGTELSYWGVTTKNFYTKLPDIIREYPVGRAVQADFFPYSDVADTTIRTKIVQSIKTGETEIIPQTHATAAPIGFPDFVPASRGRENLGLSTAPGVATNFLRTSYTYPYQYSFTGQANMPVILSLRSRLSPVTNWDFAKMPYPESTLIMADTGYPFFSAPKMLKGGREAEFVVPSVEVTSDLLRSAGVNAPKKPPLIKEIVPFKVEPVYKSDYRGAFGKRFGFKDYTIVDDVFVPIRDANFKGLKYTVNVPIKESGEGGYAKEEYFVSEKDLRAIYGDRGEGVKFGKLVKDLSKEERPLAPEPSSSRGTPIKTSAGYLLSSLSVSRSSSSPFFTSSGSSASSPQKFGYSSTGSYSSSFSSLGSYSSSSSSGGSYSSGSSSLGSFGSSLSSFGSSSSSSSYGSSYGSGSSSRPSSSFTTSTSPPFMPFLQFPSMSYKTKRKKSFFPSKSYKLRLQFGSPNFFISNTASPSATSTTPRRNEALVKEFKYSRRIGTDYFKTSEERRKPSLGKKFGFRL